MAARRSRLALLAKSPAINGGGRGSGPTDQRGVPGRRDISAYEFLRCAAERWSNLVGTSGEDWLAGTSRADGVLGLGGRDTLKGRAGKDGLCGGGGRDKLKGRRQGHLIAAAKGETSAGAGQKGRAEELLELYLSQVRTIAFAKPSP